MVKYSKGFIYCEEDNNRFKWYYRVDNKDVLSSQYFFDTEEEALEDARESIDAFLDMVNSKH